jgi:hypothetical protein
MNGKIMKTVDEQYVRQDVPCGLSDCPLCDKNFSCRIKLEQTATDSKMVEDDQAPGCNRVFIIDHWFAADQIDLIENCDILRNVVVSDSVLKYLNKS